MGQDSFLPTHRTSPPGGVSPISSQPQSPSSQPQSPAPPPSGRALARIPSSSPPSNQQHTSYSGSSGLSGQAAVSSSFQPAPPVVVVSGPTSSKPVRSLSAPGNAPEQQTQLASESSVMRGPRGISTKPNILNKKQTPEFFMMDTKPQELANLNVEIKALTTKKEALEEQTRLARTQQEQLVADINNLTSQKLVLTGRITEIQSKVNWAQEKQDLLTSDITDLERQRADLQNRKQLLQGELTGLKHQNRELEEEKQALVTKKQESELEANSLTDKIQNQKELFIQYTKEIETLEKEIKVKKSVLADIETNISRSQTLVEVWQSNVDGVSFTLEKKKGELATLEIRETELTVTLKKNSEVSQTLENEILRKKENLASVNQTLNETLKEYDQLKTNVQKESSSLTTLKSSVQDETQKVAEAQNTFTQLLDKTTGLKSEILVLEETKNSLTIKKEEINEIESRWAIAQADYEKKQHDFLTILALDKAEKEQELTQVTSQLTQAKADLEFTQAEILRNRASFDQDVARKKEVLEKSTKELEAMYDKRAQELMIREQKALELNTYNAECELKLLEERKVVLEDRNKYAQLEAELTRRTNAVEQIEVLWKEKVQQVEQDTNKLRQAEAVVSANTAQLERLKLELEMLESRAKRDKNYVFYKSQKVQFDQYLEDANFFNEKLTVEQALSQERILEKTRELEEKSILLTKKQEENERFREQNLGLLREAQKLKEANRRLETQLNQVAEETWDSMVTENTNAASSSAPLRLAPQNPVAFSSLTSDRGDALGIAAANALGSSVAGKTQVLRAFPTQSAPTFVNKLAQSSSLTPTRMFVDPVSVVTNHRFVTNGIIQGYSRLALTTHDIELVYFNLDALLLTGVQKLQGNRSGEIFDTFQGHQAHVPLIQVDPVSVGKFVWRHVKQKKNQLSPIPYETLSTKVELQAGVRIHTRNALSTLSENSALPKGLRALASASEQHIQKLNSKGFGLDTNLVGSKHAPVSLVNKLHYKKVLFESTPTIRFLDDRYEQVPALSTAGSRQVFILSEQHEPDWGRRFENAIVLSTNPKTLAVTYGYQDLRTEAFARIQASSSKKSAVAGKVLKEDNYLKSQSSEDAAPAAPAASAAVPEPLTSPETKAKTVSVAVDSMFSAPNTHVGGSVPLPAIIPGLVAMSTALTFWRFAHPASFKKFSTWLLPEDPQKKAGQDESIPSASGKQKVDFLQNFFNSFPWSESSKNSTPPKTVDFEKSSENYQPKAASTDVFEKNGGGEKKPEKDN